MPIIVDANGTWDVDDERGTRVLLTPSQAYLDAMAAAKAVSDAEVARKLQIASRLATRADEHAAQKAAVITTFPQVQAHIRAIHATLEGLCRLQRGDILADLP